MKNTFYNLILICCFSICLDSCSANPSKKEMEAFSKAMQNNNQQKQLIEINKLIIKYPKSYITYANRITVLLSLRDIDGSIKDCLKMIEIEPKNAIIKVELGMLYIIKDNNKDANKQLEDAVILYKNQLENKVYKDKKQIISMNLYLPLCLLNRKDEAEALISNYVDKLTQNQKDVLQILNTNSRIEIAKIFCQYN